MVDESDDYLDPRTHVPRIEQALAFAIKAHEGQSRKGTAVPYVTHPIGVALLLAQYGATTSMQVAGILHDTVEDTAVTIEEIRATFGLVVATIVQDLSETKVDEVGVKLPWHERKQAALHHLATVGYDSAIVKLADALHNALSLAQELERDGASAWSRFNASPSDIVVYYSAILALSWRTRDKMSGALSNVIEVLAKHVVAYAATQPSPPS